MADEDAFAALKAALEAGCNYWDGGELYGTPDCNSLTLLRKYFAKYPEDAGKVVLNIKGCSFENFRPDSSREGVRTSIENCVRMLGPAGRIYQFEAARKDPKVPIELTMMAYKEHIRAGNIRQAALSEVSADTIRRAAKVTKVGAVEVELSLWNTLPLENGVAATCADLGIPILAYCMRAPRLPICPPLIGSNRPSSCAAPLGRGALTGAIKSLDDIPKGDFRRMLPRFQPENLETNLKLAKAVGELAEKKGCTVGQIAIGWILGLSRRPGMPKIIPIPGSTNVERIRENATEVELADDEMVAIDQILAEFPVVGERYHKLGMDLIES